MENKKELSDKDIQALIWLELVNSEKHSLFMDWLNKNFDIKMKDGNAKKQEWLFSAYKSAEDYNLNNPYFTKYFTDFDKMKEFSSAFSYAEKSKYPNYVSGYVKTEIETEKQPKTNDNTIPLHKDIKEIIMKEYQKGNIVVATTEGLQCMPLKEFIKQPADGMLYDLNRSEMVVLTFIKDPKWINDYAISKVVRELKQQLDEKTSKIGDLIQGEYYIEAKIVTGGMFRANDNQKLIEGFKAHGFKFKGEPITQDNDTVHWTIMEKNNGLVKEY